MSAVHAPAHPATPSPAQAPARPTAHAPAHHPWRVVAPWYRWPRADGAEPERAADADRPALHKYASTEFVADFLRDPQRTLVFDEALDVHQTVQPIPAAALNGGNGRLKSLSKTRLVPSTTRKLFLPAHGRFYMVAAGVHCDAPGFPKVDAGSIDQVGFVVRRHRVVVEPAKRAKGAALLAELTQARAVADSRRQLDVAKARTQALHPFSAAARQRVSNPGEATRAAFRDVELARRRLRVWAEEAGVEQRTEGWVPAGEGTFGSWVPIADEPSELVERSYPMRLLPAVPEDPDHAARFGTVYFGNVPTASDEVTFQGTSRFTELDTYEIRVYARRKACDPCPGELVWSTPTKAFRLASFYDPAGCSLRPMDVRLPDFAELAASSALPSVRMSQPAGSSLVFASNGAIPKKGKVGVPEQICFFSIPLITIIAMFVLNLFLPIVMFVFGLWWMLKLKFCIPPSVSFEAQLTAELDVTPPELEAVAALDVDIRPGVNQAALRNLLRGIFTTPPDPQIAPAGTDSDPAPYQLGDELTAEFTNDPLLKLAVRNGYGRSGAPAPTYAVPSVYTSPVRREDVVHP